MKKLLALLVALMMCLSFVSCGAKRSPEEKLPDEVEEYVSENFRIQVGSDVSEPVNVDVASVVEMKKESKWAVLGTYTVKVGKEIMSAKFGMVATYNETSGDFTFSEEKFDDFE